MIDPVDNVPHVPVADQDETTGVEPPDLTATADALGGNANLPRVDYDPSTHPDGAPRPA